MMDCKKAEELICRAIDGQLAEPDRAGLEQHAHECAPCAAFRDDLARNDRELRAAFEAPRAMASAIAEKTIATLRAERVQPRFRLWAALVPLAAAAGFLGAFFGFPREVPVPIIKEVTVYKEVRVRDLPGDQVADPVKQPTGRIALVAGTMEMRPRDAETWSACGATDSFEMGTTVRCARGAFAEIVTSEGSRVRLNGGTEVQFLANRNLVLRQGELMSAALPSKSGMDYRISTPSGAVVTKSATVNVACTLLAEEGKKLVERVRTVVTVLDGRVTVEDKSLDAPSCMSAYDNDWSVPRDVDPVLATRWVHPLLARAGATDEIAERVSKMAARAGDLKYAQEIRALGEQAGPALIACLAKGDGDRARTAKLASDLAGPACLRSFIDLLADKDGEVRGCAFDGLVRLSGETLGQRRAEWVAGGFGCGSDPHNAWLRWHDQRTGKRVDTK